MNTPFNYNGYRNKGDITDVFAPVDNHIEEYVSKMGVMGVEGEFARLFSNTPHFNGPVYQELTRKYYFDSEGMVEAGLDDEAPLIHGTSGFDTKSTTPRGRHARVRFSRSELKYWDSTSQWVPKLESFLKKTISKFYSDFNQAGADMLLRGFETSYPDAFDSTITIDGRDMEGSNPLFAPNHKVMSGTPNSYRCSNVCVEIDSNTPGVAGVTINPVLSEDSILDTYQYAMRARDYDGLPFGTTRKLNTILCSDYQARLVLKLITAEFELNTANNDPNLIPLIIGNGLKYFTWYRTYADSQGDIVNPTSNTAYQDFWWMFDLGKVSENLHYRFEEAPIVKKENEHGNSESVAYYTRPEFRMWFSGFENIFGSNATEGAAPADFPLV